jgi:alkanesulfonate monooxygenase SsuD/methylene tetrahydromethanopterin reductase-like flavin-dependent oxidoreductase (luciferase family)
MKISTMLQTLAQATDESDSLEALGYDALFTNEAKHDPFIMAALAAARTSRVDLMTYIAVAFARTPMLAAHAAHDVNALSKGRFTLGLGSQIKPHITRRFAMPWSHPAPRMKEFIRALHAIWDCWYDGKPLQFEGEFYSHTLTSPMFLPEDRDYGRPKVMLAAVGPEMTKVAAEVADGLLCHSFTTERYLREVTAPTVATILERHGRSRQAFRLVGMPRRFAPSRAPSGSTPRRRRIGPCSICTTGAAFSLKCCGCRSLANGSRWASSSATTCSKPSAWLAMPSNARGN